MDAITPERPDGFRQNRSPVPLPLSGPGEPSMTDITHTAAIKDIITNS
jgi:hypothetical protein